MKKWTNVEQRLLGKIQSLERERDVYKKALEEIHETSGWLMVSSFHSRIAEGLKSIRKTSEQALGEE